jgi:hypothetical protein
MVTDHAEPVYFLGANVATDHYGEVSLEQRAVTDVFLSKNKIANVTFSVMRPATKDGHGVDLHSGISSYTLCNLFYLNWSHKESDRGFVRQWFFGAMEAGARQVVMQFDMPADQSEVLAACTTVDKKGHRR